MLRNSSPALPEYLGTDNILIFTSGNSVDTPKTLAGSFWGSRQTVPWNTIEEEHRNSGRNQKGRLLLRGLSERTRAQQTDHTENKKAREASSAEAGVHLAPSDFGVEFLAPLNLYSTGRSAWSPGMNRKTTTPE